MARSDSLDRAARLASPIRRPVSATRTSPAKWGLPSQGIRGTLRYETRLRALFFITRRPFAGQLCLVPQLHRHVLDWRGPGRPAARAADHQVAEATRSAVLELALAHWASRAGSQVYHPVSRGGLGMVQETRPPVTSMRISSAGTRTRTNFNSIILPCSRGAPGRI